MKFLKSTISSAILVLLCITVLISCEEDVTTIGSGLVPREPFTYDKAIYDVFAYNKNINAVETNRLAIYQLGAYSDPIYGRTEARITSQLGFSSTANPVFGNYSQQTENNSQSDGNNSTIQENERVVDVFLYIPYLRPGNADRDGDGVDDEFDVDPDDPNSDSDGDGLTDNQERIIGTDPLNPDTDGDGILDGDDDNSNIVRFPKRFALDSIFGNREAPFNLKVERSTYFLRDLDPGANFQEAQAYYSNQQFSPNFVSDVLFDGEVTISDMEMLFFKEDDPETEDVDESKEVETALNPGIRVSLNKEFFQTNILNKEGSTELISDANFKEFIRGIHMSVTPTAGDILLLLDITQASITINYEFDRVNTNDTSIPEDDTIVVEKRSYPLRLIAAAAGGGNAVNSFVNEAYPGQVLDNLDTNTNASRIYLKGGAGVYSEIKLFDENNGQEIINQIKANNWIINEANLVFYVDRTALDAAGNVMEPPRLYLFNAETNAPIYSFRSDNFSQTSSLGSFLNYDGRLQKSGDKGVKYKIRITEYINNLVVRDSVNATLGLSLTSDLRNTTVKKAVLTASERNVPTMSTVNPLGTVLIGSNVGPMEEDKKLKLEIFYTKAN